MPDISSLPVAAPRMRSVNGRPVRVLIVDDSLTMREWLRVALNKDTRLEVVGQAADARQARALIKELAPDVITLDIEMPQMNGLAFLERLMRLRPMPVVMLSTLTSRGSAAAVQALALGALDCIWKPSDPRDMEIGSMCERVYNAAKANVANHRAEPHAPKHRTADRPNLQFHPDQILLVGASTGGVAALETMLGDMPKASPPIVIAQHMPKYFLKSFATRLDTILPHDVAVAKDGERLKNGQIRIAPADSLQTAVLFTNNRWKIVLRAPQGYEQYVPSVDHLFYSALPHASRVGAVILTGLGRDGAAAMLELCKKGATTLAQSEQSCVVYGMPKAAKEIGACQDEADIENITSRLLARIKKNSGT